MGPESSSMELPEPILAVAIVDHWDPAYLAAILDRRPESILVPQPGTGDPGITLDRPAVRLFLRQQRPTLYRLWHERALGYAGRQAQMDPAWADEVMLHVDALFQFLIDYADLPGLAAMLASVQTLLWQRPEHRQRLLYYRAVLAGEQCAYPQARSLLAELLADPHLDRRLQARAHNSSGLFCHWQGYLDLAITHFQAALPIFAALNDSLAQGKTLHNLAILYQELADADQAIVAATASLTHCRAAGEPFHEARALNELAAAHKDLGHWEQALEQYRACLEIRQRLGDRVGAAVTQENIGEIHLLQGRLEQATVDFQQALNGLPDLPLLQADIRANLGLVAHVIGQFAQAHTHYTQSLAQVETTSSPAYQALLHARLGMLAEAQSALDQAETSYRTAITAIETWRGQISNESIQIQMFDTRQGPYQMALRLAVQRGQPLQALEMVERARSRAFLDLLTSRASASPTPFLLPASASEIQQRVPEDTVLIEYFLTGSARQRALLAQADSMVRRILLIPAEAYALVIRPDQVAVYPLPLKPEALDSLLKPERPVLPRLTPDAGGRLQPAWILAHLATALLAPLADAWQDARRLCVIPHGPLHYIPFHALRSDLLDHGPAIRYAPSATIWLDHCLPQAQRVDQHALLAAGRGLIIHYGPDLVHAPREAEAIAHLTGSTLWTSETARRSSIQKAASAASFLHFACHGRFRPEAPLESALLLADGPLTAAEVLDGWHLAAAWVTLSACETGQSRVVGGDELMGLVRAFLAAGTPAVLVSLWPVDELSTRILMEQFYRGVLAGLDKAEALRQAQRTVRDLPASALANWLPDEAEAEATQARLQAANSALDPERPFAHPYYWAGFELVGE